MDPLIIPVLGIAVPIILVPTVLGIRHARHVRELEHAERMRALELGRILPQDESWWSPARICIAIGAGVPIGTFVSAWMASETLGFFEPIWASAGVVGLAGVISGTVLAGRYFASRDRFARVADKPYVDAEAYDVVSSRG
jgi:hypothetical protein